MEGSDLRASRRSSFIADAMHKMSFTSNMTKAFSRMGRKLSYAQYAPELSALEVAALANATAANEGVQNARLLWERHRLIDPRAVAKHRWDLLMFVFVFYNCVMIPFQLAFLSPLGVLQDELDVLDYVVDAFFWVDIALSFRTSSSPTRTAPPRRTSKAIPSEACSWTRSPSGAGYRRSALKTWLRRASVRRTATPSSTRPNGAAIRSSALVLRR